MAEFEVPEHFFLYNLLITKGKITMVFRTGMFKQFTFESNQYPLKPAFTEIHKTALTGIPLLIHHDGAQYFIMVSANNQTHIQRREYMIKRAILDLQEKYGWEVSVC